MFKDLQVCPIWPLETTYVVTWSILQKMWASSCWKRRTLVRPVSVPDSSFLCRTPKSASLRGSSLHDRGLWLNIRLQDSRRARRKVKKKHIKIRRLWHEFDLLHRGKRLQMFTLWILPVPRAVHGLEREEVFFHREGEHVFAVVLPVARCLPQFAVIDVGGGYFLKASSPVLLLDKWQKPHKQAQTSSLPAQVLYWAELMTSGMKTWATTMQLCREMCSFFLIFRKQLLNIQLSCFTPMLLERF